MNRLDTGVLDHLDVENLAREWESAAPEEILQWVTRRIPHMALPCSFGAEDMVLVDMLQQIAPNVVIFYLDTDVLFAETHELRDRALKRYGLHGLRRVSPQLTLSRQAEQYGEELWKHDPNQCCAIRKVEPLTRVLAEFDGWITGIRRNQAPTRARTQVIEMDHKFGLIKVNPLALWTESQIWGYIHTHEVPYNPLHDQGYPSIGCLHCTRSVRPGEDARAGRWSGSDKTECGLHSK